MSCMSCILFSHLFQPFTSSQFSRMIPPQLHQTHMPIFKIVIVSGSLSASASSRPADFPISAKAKAPHSSPAVSDGACAKARHDCATGSSLCFRLGSRSRKTQKWKKQWLGSQSGRIKKSQSRLRELSGSLLFCRRPKRIINAVC